MKSLDANRESSLEILLVGPAESDDLAWAVGELRDWTARASIAPLRVVLAPDVDAALIRLATAAVPPACVAVLQGWPGQTPAADLDRLRRAAPLAAICGLLGSWCEGETRSGKPWPGTLRCPWSLWLGRIAREMAGLAAGRVTSWSLPATSSPEEALLAAIPFQPREPAASDRGLLAIVAESRETRSALADAAHSRGYRTVAFASAMNARAAGAAASGAAATLWDASPEAATDAAAARDVRAAAGDAPLLALVGFPRAEDAARARAAGVAAVIAKPFLLEDLFWRLEEVRSAAPQ